MSHTSVSHSTESTTKSIRGHACPALGFGTYELAGTACRNAVSKALDTGYRHVDTARIYKNEEDVGAGIRAAGIDRADLFLTSKVWWEDLSADAIRAEVDASLKALRTDYLDLALIHWPNPAYPLQQAIETFRELEDDGKIRLYGVSNFPPSLFRAAIESGDIFANQVEYHPFLGQQPLLDAVRSNDSALIAYSPLAQGEAIGYPELEEIAGKHGKSSEQVALRWLIEQDNVLAIPRSSNPQHIESNFDIFDFSLDDSDRQQIADLPKDRRQVNPDFAPDWESDKGGA